MPMFNESYAGAGVSSVISPYSPNPYGPAPYSRAWIAATKCNGVAGCMSWAPENRREIIVSRNNDNYHNQGGAVRYAHDPMTSRRSDGHWVTTTYLEPNGIANNVTTQATQTSVRERVAAQAIDEGFTRDVINAVHNSGDLGRMNEYNNGYAPRPPTGKSSTQKYGFVNNRRVLVADPFNGRRSSSAVGRSTSPPPPDQTLVVRPNTGYFRPHHLEVACEHHYHTPESQSSSVIDQSRSRLRVTQPTNDYWTGQQLNHTDGYLDDDVSGIYRTTATPHNDTLREYQQGVGYDVNRHQQQQLVKLREAAAEERKKLLSIYQKVKSDEKFYGPVAWRDNWQRMTSSGATTIEGEATEQVAALAESQERLSQLLDRREQLQRQYVRSQQIKRSLSSSSLRGTRSRCGSPCRGTTAAGDRYIESSTDTGANQRYVTVYNPGRSTPVGSYYATDSNRPLTQYYTSSAGGQGAEEGNPNQVNLKVECQPNTDTVLSLRVRSNQL